MSLPSSPIALLQRLLGLQRSNLIAADASCASQPEAQPSVHARTAIVSGWKVFYREAGRPDAPVIVLLHGFPSSSHMFRDLIPRLATHFRVIAPDYIGFGHSDAPGVEAFSYTFDSLAAVVRDLLGQLGVERAIYYLHDYGGPIGLRLAVQRPEAVAGLVIQNANAYMEGVSGAVREVFLPLWQHGDERGARQMLLAETTRFQYTAGARQPASLNPDAWLHDQALLDRPGSVERQLALFRDYQGNVERYPQWQQYFRQHQPRTLVAWGRHDPFFTVEGAEAYARDLTDIDVHLLDSNHFALEEDAALVADLIVRRFPTA